MEKRFILFLGFAVFLILFSFSFFAENESVVAVDIEINISNSSNISYNPGDIFMTNFIPKYFKLGDVQFNIQILNNKNESLSNIMAFISGKGYSTYDIVPIDYLKSGEKDYIFVNGNFKESGNITLTIKIDKSVFYQNVSVSGNSVEVDKMDEERKKALESLNLQITDLELKYNQLDDELSEKKDSSYDVSKVNLDDLKSFIRQTKISIIGEDVESAKKSLAIAIDEYNDQKNKLDKVTKISLLTRLKDNAVLFSALAGALIMFFTLSELLRKKGQGVFSGVSSIGKKVVGNGRKKKKR